jgi:hypothetical protein
MPRVVPTICGGWVGPPEDPPISFHLSKSTFFPTPTPTLTARCPTLGQLVLYPIRHHAPFHFKSTDKAHGTLLYRSFSASLPPVLHSLTEPGSWGHEYVHIFAAELGEEYTFRVDEEGVEPAPPAPLEDTPAEAQEPPPPVPVEIVGSIEDLRLLAIECAKLLLAHNAEPDAVDLLEELEIVDRITELVDKDAYVRVTQYTIQ